jgi:hypothetical protein
MIVIELGARQRAASVDEFHLIDDAFVALATGDPKRRTSCFGACLSGRERRACGLQAIERLLDFETNLLRDFFLA